MALHPQAVVALELAATGPSVSAPGFGAADLAALRDGQRALAADESREAVSQVEDVDAGGVRCRLHAPADASRRTVVYRRPPEHRFPAAPDDVDTVLGWLTGAGRDLATGPVVAVGDSAGANLALVAALRNPGALAACVLVYPFLDPTTSSASYVRTDGGLTRADAAWYWQQYARGPEDLTDPDLAPLLADELGRLPPTLVQVAEHDTLVEEDLDLVRRLDAAGVPVQATTYAGMIHGFWRQPALFDASEQALAEVAAFLAVVG